MINQEMKEWIDRIDAEVAKQWVGDPGVPTIMRSYLRLSLTVAIAESMNAPAILIQDYRAAAMKAAERCHAAPGDESSVN